MQGKARQDKQQGRKAKATLQVGCFENFNLRQFLKKFSQLKKSFTPHVCQILSRTVECSTVCYFKQFSQSCPSSIDVLIVSSGH